VPDGEVHALTGAKRPWQKYPSPTFLWATPAMPSRKAKCSSMGENLLDLEVWERARKGLFLAFQYPAEIPGVTVSKFLKRIADLRRNPPRNTSVFLSELKENLRMLDIEPAFVNRYLNDGFSGGEKKRMEILQLLTIQPRFAIFDETDSGLDIDALKVVAAGINHMRGPGFSALVITHYRRLLDLVKPDKVHILEKGHIVACGGFELVELLERDGYDGIRRIVANPANPEVREAVYEH